MVPGMQPQATPPGHAPDRRRVVTLSALTVLGGTTLAACGAASGATTSTAAGAGASGALAKLADVPVGGAVAAQGPGGPIIVAQPTAGQVVAHSAVCTHAGCMVAPAGAQLACPCHGSIFDAFTGAVVRGPATAPLAAVPVKVSGQDVVAG
jgi:cytochrome b6-f complex iron-sulfur subunit